MVGRGVLWASLLLLAGGWTAGARADVLVWDLAYPDPVLAPDLDGEVLLIEQTRLAGAPGHPLLPLDRVIFLLPAGHQPVAVKLEGLQTETLAGRFQIAPAQPARPPARSPGRLVPPDPGIYGSDESVFASFVEVGSVQAKRGYGLFTVLVHPLAYHPASGRVDRLVSARLVVTTRPAAVVSGLYRARDRDVAEALAGVDEISALGTYPAAPAAAPLGRLDPDDRAYLIVTPQAFANLGGAHSLEALVALRQGLGLSAGLVTLEWIQSAYDGVRPDGGADDATRIRDFLTDAYSSWGTRYVLLVGDADGADRGGESGDDLLPVRKFYMAGLQTGADTITDFIPADMYYACLDGSFDHDGDGRYGEPNDGPGGGPVDLMAELYVGRAPADSAIEVTQFVAKTMAYEASLGAGLRDVWMVGENLNETNLTWGGDYLDDLISGSSVAGFITAGFDSEPYFDCHTLYDRDAGFANAWGAADVAAVLNNSPHIVNHLGHSNEFHNMRMDSGDADQLINQRPFLQYSQGCYNGAFDNQMDESGYINSQDCFAEHLVMGAHGAFAAIVNSRYGLYVPGSTDSPSQAFHRTFWDAVLAEDKAEIGRALADSKEELAFMFNDASYRWVGYEINLLGDPALRLKRNLTPSDPLLGVYPPALGFVTRYGETAPQAQELTVANDGVGSLGWTATPDQGWLSVNPASGQAGAAIEVAVDPVGLTPGEHLGVVTFESAEAINSPFAVAVRVEVVDPPTLFVPHGTLAPDIDGLMQAGEWDQALRLPIDEAGSGTVLLQAQVTGNTLYLGVEDFLDTHAEAWGEWQLLFDQDLDGAWPPQAGGEGLFWYLLGGRYFIPLYNAGQGLGQGQSVENPPGFSLASRFVGGHRVFEAALDLNASELDVGPTGQFAMALRVGYQYLERVRIGRWPWVVPTIADQRFFGLVDLDPPGAALAASPRVLRFAAIVGAAAPAAQIVDLVDVAGADLQVAAAASQPWIAVSPTAGRTPIGLTVSVDPTGLPRGAHYGYVELTCAGAWNAPFRIPVHLELLDAPASLFWQPESFALTVVEGQAAPTLDLSIENRGGRATTYSVGADQAWLAFAPMMGSLAPGEAVSLRGMVVLDGLALGLHQATISVAAPEAENSPAAIGVSLEILPDGPDPNRAPPTPNHRAPADGSLLAAGPDLVVDAVEDPDGDPLVYTFVVLSAEGAVVETGEGAPAGDGVIWTPTTRFQPGQSYLWQVLAADDRGGQSDWSGTWSFALEAPVVDGGDGGGGDGDPPAGGGCGCGAGGAAGPGAWILLCLALAAGRRRRRSRP